MALTIVGRYNLAGGPNKPAMKNDGELFYLQNNANVRRAIWNVSDVAFAAVPVAAQDPGFPGGRQSLIVNNNYVTLGNGTTAARWVFVDITTGVVVGFVGGVIHTWGGRIFTDGINVIGIGNTGGTPNFFTSKVIPPVAAEVITAGAGYVNWGGFGGHDITTALFFDRTAIADRKQFCGTAGNFEVVGPNAFINTVTPQMSGAIAAASARGPFSDTRPELLATRKFYFYESILDSFVGHVYGMMNARNNAGVTLGTGLWRTPLSAWPNWNSGAEYFYPIAGYSGGIVMSFGGVHINQQFGKLYMVGGNLGFKLQHALLGAWPPTFQTPLDLDTTAGEISGIWSFPPYVYVSKFAGATFGNQLIKLYDDDLTLRRRARRSGGELWALIPEMKDYLG